MSSIVLVGNYRPDRQESMLRFTRLLAEGLGAVSRVSVWEPVVVFGRAFADTTRGVGKWFGYVDKWVLTPAAFALRRLGRAGGTRYHVCDHSNAPYLAVLPRERTSATCHDVLAIRGARGDAEAHCPASPTGEYYQRYIFSYLRRFRRLACVSATTKRQLERLALGRPEVDPVDWRVIYNPFNGDFRPVGELPQRDARLRERPYLLHVGGGHPRKNRRMLVRMLAVLEAEFPDLLVCYAGEAVDDSLTAEAARLGVGERVVSLPGPDHAELLRLYSHCAAFVFPSYAEGFGWPLTEAQACGAPVIASAREPMPEVSGGAALHAGPDDVAEFAEAYRRLAADEGLREELRARGLRNVARFESRGLLREYAAFILGGAAVTRWVAR